MKIGIARREYITHFDGVNRFCAHLAEGLRKEKLLCVEFPKGSDHEGFSHHTEQRLSVP